MTKDVQESDMEPCSPSESHLGYHFENIESYDEFNVPFFLTQYFSHYADGVRLFLFEGQDKLQFSVL